MLKPYTETRLRVRYQETDQMKVVHHTSYFNWFEVGRSDFIRQNGWSYQQFEKKGLFLPVIDAHCRYFAPAHYDEEVIVETRVTELSGSKMSFSYEVFEKENKTLLVKGSTVHLWVDSKMKRVNIAQSFPEVYDRLEKIK